MNRSAALLLVLINVAQAAAASEWSYHGDHGPEHWGELKSEYALCAKGVNQSPVDIRGAVEADLPTLEMAGTSRITRGFNNGHTVQFDFAPGLRTSLGDKSFELKQVHFHAPSENLIDSHAMPLEAHFVHASEKGDLAVIAVMYIRGQANRSLETLWGAVDHGGGDAAIDDGGHWKELMPRDLDYFYFSGSLTTPPCTEGVHWMVLKNRLTVSADQLAMFGKMVGGKNARPAQPRNARLILR